MNGKHVPYHFSCVSVGWSGLPAVDCLLDLGECSTQWTQSLVITLPKKGNLQCQNYPMITIALDRQGTQQQRRESPIVTPPGVRVNTRYVISTEGTASKKDAPCGISTLHFRHTRRHRRVQAHDRNNFYSRSDVVLRSRNWLNI